MVYEHVSLFKSLIRQTTLNVHNLVVCIFFFLALSVTVYIPVKRCFSSEYTQEQRNLIEKYRRLNLSFDSFTNLVAGPGNKVYQFNKSSPFIFISSVDEYSGASYLKKLLNTHWNISCGKDVNLISKLLMMRKKSMSTEKERARLELGGVGPEIFNHGLAAFILEILTRQSKPAGNLCNVDYYSVQEAQVLYEMFPQSRYIMVIRDGRAVAHNKMPFNHNSTTFNSTMYREHLKRWNALTHEMILGCLSVGRMRCLAVYYEHLLLHPVHTLQRILAFLKIPFPRHHDTRGFAFYDEMEAALQHGNDPNVRKKLSTWSECASAFAYERSNITSILWRFGYLKLGYPPDYQKLNQKALLADTLY